MKKPSLLAAIFGAKDPIPAEDPDRLELVRLVFNYRLDRDTPTRKHFQEYDLTAEDIPLEVLLTFQEGILVKLTEQHLSHMDQFYSMRHGMSKKDFEACHINFMNTTHHAFASGAGYELPLDETIRTIQDYIAHYFVHMPEEVPNQFPHHLIPPCVELVKRFYRR